MKKKTNISDNALKTIVKNQIKPIPKLEFIIKNWGLWMGFIFCLFLLILGFGESWFGLFGNIMTPYLWMVITLVFLILTFWLFEKTKKAYRFPKWQVVGLIILIGLSIGGTIFKIGLANQIDKKLEANLPYYRHMAPMKLEFWNKPEEGYLSGKIIKIISNNEFVLEGFDQKIWNINYQNAIIRGRVNIDVGGDIKIIGKIDNNVFLAKEIRPWNGRKQNMMKENY